MTKAEVKLILNGEEIDSHEFEDVFDGEHFFDNYPLDEFCEEVQLFEYMPNGHWEMVDIRTLIPDID